MNARKIALALAAGGTLLAAAPAFADPGRWAPAHGWRAKHHHHHHHYRSAAYVYYPARPVVVVPPPRVVYAPPPVYYGRPAPVLYGHVPVSPNVGVSFGVRF
jgi:hypothetical protein